MVRVASFIGVLLFASSLALSAEDGSGTHEAAIGETFTLGDYSYAIKGASLSADVGDRYFGKGAEEGAKFVVITFSILNNTNQTQIVLADDFELLDSQGRTYSVASEASVYLGGDFILRELQPGLVKIAKCVFEVPENALQGSIKLMVPEKGFFFTGKEYVDLGTLSAVGRPAVPPPMPAPMVAPTPNSTPLPATPSSATPTPQSTPSPTLDFSRLNWPDGRILKHPKDFAETYIVNVAPNDTLTLRSGPGTRFTAITELPADAADIFAFDKDAVWDGDTWWYPIEWHGFRGYVGGNYLPHDQ